MALELGSNSANVVHEDVKDVKKVAELLAKYAFLNAGQVCISCQRVYVSRSICKSSAVQPSAFAKNAFKGGKLSGKDDMPRPDDCGEEAIRIEGWVNDAVARWCQTADGRSSPRCLLRADHSHGCHAGHGCRQERDVRTTSLLYVIPYDTIEEAIAGVQRPLVTACRPASSTSLYIAHYAAEHIEASGVVINDGSGFRMVNMPYGGVKGGGMGKKAPSTPSASSRKKTIIMNFD